MYRLTDLQSEHLDLLKEAGNVGAAHAATSLSVLLNRRINMNVPSVQVIPLNEITCKETEKYVAATLININGDLKGCFFMIVEVDSANQLIQSFLPGGSVTDEDIGKSAFCELSNILCGSYLTALSSFLQIRMTQSPPALAVDMAGAILGEGMIELSRCDDYVLLIDTVLVDGSRQKNLEGEFLFLPFPDSVDRLFTLTEGKFFR
ncbi:chemotaxis protein CheC [Sporolactobacillus sp. THM19-2]|nr:chemotaxis protein CheC [Sporolactobacillus sp. THM19-2]